MPANRDSEQFWDPDEVVLDRSRIVTRRSAWASTLPRIEPGRAQFGVVVETVLRRTPDYRVLPGACRYPRRGQVNGYERMPIEFTPHAPLR